MCSLQTSEDGVEQWRATDCSPCATPFSMFCNSLTCNTNTFFSVTSTSNALKALALASPPLPPYKHPLLLLVQKRVKFLKLPCDSASSASPTATPMTFSIIIKLRAVYPPTGEPTKSHSIPNTSVSPHTQRSHDKAIG